MLFFAIIFVVVVLFRNIDIETRIVSISMLTMGVLMNTLYLEKETTIVIVMEEVTIVAEVIKEKPVVKKQVKKKQVEKPVVKKQVIDVPGSIRAWNEEAWCRPYWDKGEKCYFKDRQEEYPLKAKAIAKAFLTVWGNEPIEVQKLALSICLKETGCGFSEQRSYRKRNGIITNEGGTRIWRATKFMSKREACGLTQVDTRDNIGKVKCATLNKSYENAFKWQKIWLQRWWNDGHKTKPTKVDLYGSEWLQPYEIDEDNTSYLVWRYNGGGKNAWRYGRVVMKIYHNYIKTK